MKRKKVLALALSAAMVLTFAPATALAAGSSGGTESYSMKLEDYNGNWSYNETYDCYQLLNVVYCTNPENVAYEALNIYVPAGYVKSFSEGEIVFDEAASVNGYTTKSAPIIYCNGASGWSAKTVEQVTLEGLSRKNLELNYTECIKNGFVLVGVGSRGSASTSADGTFDGKVPNNIVDVKAGLRFIKANDAYLPGTNARIISAGTSGGGGMSAILGASGKSDDYDAYLREIGAIMTEDDTVFGDMCYCPISDLDNADLGYSWMYQNQLYVNSRGSVTELTEFQKALNADLASEYENYIVDLNLDARYAADFDNYAMDIARMFEVSYETHLKTYFSTKTAAAEDAAQYDWLTYDQDNGKVTIKGDSGREKLDNLIAAGHNTRGKSCPGFDIPDASLDSRAECNLFGVNGTTVGSGHFSKRLANTLIANNAKYSSLEGYEDYTRDYALALTDAMQQRAKMLNPMYYIQEYIGGTTNVQPAKHFRLMVGSQDSNTTPTVVFNLGKLLEKADIDVEYAYVWGLGHGTRDIDDSGEKMAFINWVNEICDEDDNTGTNPDQGITIPDDEGNVPPIDNEETPGVSGDSSLPPVDHTGNAGNSNSNVGAGGVTSPKTADSRGMLVVVLLAAAGVAVTVKKRVIS